MTSKLVIWPWIFSNIFNISSDNIDSLSLTNSRDGCGTALTATIMQLSATKFEFIFMIEWCENQGGCLTTRRDVGSIVLSTTNTRFAGSAYLDRSCLRGDDLEFGFSARCLLWKWPFANISCHLLSLEILLRDWVREYENLSYCWFGVRHRLGMCPWQPSSNPPLCQASRVTQKKIHLWLSLFRIAEV